ncbi:MULTISPECIES: pentapeptide repeat-containing protein [Shewanella]|uniref:pentapeptide repeat-containing protein n=1 Tax=Shewanella TaxID=22 RepID=UPI003007313D
MTANDRNRYAFSYVNHDAREKNFIYKNFNKSSSYHSNFSKSKFVSSSFIGTKFKFCSFYGAEFKECLIRGTLFRKCNLQTATFTNCMLAANVFDRAKLKDCKFINCMIIGSTKTLQLIPKANRENTQVVNSFPNEAEFNSALIQEVEKLRTHDHIRRSSVLHRKNNKLDTLSLKVLTEEFGDEFLIQNLPKLRNLVTREFHTLSYIQGILRKSSADDIV